MTFEQATHLAQTWGLVLLLTPFVAFTIYALWPGNREEFNRAAHSPLNEENDDVQ